MTQPDLARLEGLVARARGLPLRQVDRERRHATATSGIETWSEAIADREGNEQFARCADDDDCSLIVAAINSLPALLARVRELTEALKPFASISRLDHWDEAADRQQANVYFGEFKSFLGALKVSDFRQAALTLNRSETDAG